MTVQLSKQAIDIGIVTSNGPAMLQFYRDVLGLKFVRELPLPGGWAVQHQLACGDSLVKILIANGSPASAAPGGIQGACGYRYFTMSVANLTEVLAACTQHGHKVVLPEREIRPGIRIGIVADPDGNFVEFLATA
jgi:catechol 2,3-dioxygenase-like lactoylglutathione lyase family enzyme